jgi:hypothetical protein
MTEIINETSIQFRQHTLATKMKTQTNYNITINTNETIIAATLSKVDEAILLMSSGNVIRLNLNNQKSEQLFAVKSAISYDDGGFDLTAKTSIYTMDEIVVVVNDYKRHGFVHYPGKYTDLHLWREDYYAEISKYPIALYKNEAGVPHLIFGEAWNHIQIMNLDTLQVLTAAKSLIEENAEENHIVFQKKYPTFNTSPWPKEYDYFFGELFISPDKKKFLSTGWAWGSVDCYTAYDIAPFIGSNRISSIKIGAWEHDNRAACWIDTNTIAIEYNPLTEEDEDATSDSPWEIHFHTIIGNATQVEKKIQIADKTLLGSIMNFNTTNNRFILFSEQDGLVLLSVEGQFIFKDGNLKIKKYITDLDLYLAFDNNTISVYEIAE